MVLYFDPMLKGIALALVIMLAANGEGARQPRAVRDDETTINACG